MTHRGAEGARIARSRSGRMVSVASLALLAPLMLSACVSDGDRLTGTAGATPAGKAGTAVADAAKPQVVEVASADKGPSRIIAPSVRPVGETAVASTETAKGGRVVVAAKTEATPVRPSLGSRAASTAVAAKNTVVAQAARVGSSAAAVASVSAATIQNVAQAAKDTITGDPKIDRMIAEAADQNDIPRELAYAVVRVESHYNPRARGSGVYGLSQIKPATARGLGFSGPTEALLDPETNLRYGMRYLKGAWEQGNGDVCQTAMKYKGGHRTTVMSKSASVYCSNVKRHMAAIRARKTPAMSDTATLVAAVEPTVRKGIVEREVAAKPVEARAPVVAASTVPAAATTTTAPAAVALNTDSAKPAIGAAAAVAAVNTPVPESRPNIRVAENRVGPFGPARTPANGTSMGGRVVHKTQPQIDNDRFGDAFDASSPTGSSVPSGGLSYN